MVPLYMGLPMGGNATCSQAGGYDATITANDANCLIVLQVHIICCPIMEEEAPKKEE